MNNIIEILCGAFLLTIFIGLCCYCISQGINKGLAKELEKQKELNKQFIGLYQNEQSRTQTLWAIIKHIRQELSLLKLKECPEEDFKNIPYEIIEWINVLEKTDRGNEENDEEKENRT